jgi:hypothetical protein
MKGIGLSSTAVEREHELGGKTLTEWMLRRQPLQLAHELVMAAESEVGLDPLLDRGEPERLEPHDLALGEALVAKLQEGRAPPQREGAPERGCGLSRLDRARLGYESLEAVDVELIRLDRKHIPAGTREEPVSRKQATQLGDVTLESRPCGLRGLMTPKGLDQAIAVENLVGMHEQDGEQRALAAPGQR